MKKLFISLQDAIMIVLVSPTKQLPELMRRGGGLEPHSLTGVSFLVSLIILSLTTSVKFSFENLDLFSMHGFQMFLIVSAWWNIFAVVFYLALNTKGMYWYYGIVESEAKRCAEENEELAHYYVEDLKRIS